MKPKKRNVPAAQMGVVTIGSMTAAQIAAATGASKRTVEGWRAGKEPPQAYRADILARIKRARARAERRTANAMQAPNTEATDAKRSV